MTNACLHGRLCVQWCTKLCYLLTGWTSFQSLTDKNVFVFVSHIVLCIVRCTDKTACWSFSVSLYSSAPARGLHRLCVLGQRLLWNPFNIWSGSNRRVSSEILFHWGHCTFAPVSWRGHHKRPCWPAQVQVRINILHGGVNQLMLDPKFYLALLVFGRFFSYSPTKPAVTNMSGSICILHMNPEDLSC